MGGRQTKETKSYFLEYGAASHQGRRPTHDDRFDVDIMLGGDQAKSYFGVFDGHFGHTAAEFCKDQLDKEIVSHPRLLLDPITAVKQSFAAVDKRFLNKAARKADRSGSTALVCILINELLIVAHCGDCRMLIRRKDKMFQVTKDHVPTRKVERRRIRRMGGMIANGRVQGRLGVSRAIGDLPYKDPHSFGERLVTSEPDVIVTQLDNTVDYILLASDGLFAKLTPTDIHTFIVATSEARKVTLMQVADQLVRYAIDSGADDNVTAVLVGFEHKPADSDFSDGSALVRTGELRNERAVTVPHSFDLDAALDVTETDETDTNTNTDTTFDEEMDDVPEDFRDEPVYE